MAVSHKPNEFREVVKVLEEKFLPFHLGHKVYLDEPISYSKDFQMEDVAFNLNLPPWLCQPVNDLDKQLVRQRFCNEIFFSFSISDWNRMSTDEFKLKKFEGPKIRQQ